MLLPPTLPPWDDRRKFIRMSEISSYCRYFLACDVSYAMAWRWIKVGLPRPGGAGASDRIYLPAKRAPWCVGRPYYVRKADLIAFLLAPWDELEADELNL